ncbi:MAG: toll/interleukin-1 receptor domain-containing protein [Mariprofundaceae bacterium]|nr:toll/interleukin-1 receptor domain-containing protein [Mariprofundaceae bacterium]
MKRIDRINLIDRIGRNLQSTMSYSDITGYLTAFGVDTKKETSDGGGSKWVYTKDLLATEPDQLILQIADELEIEHGFSELKKGAGSDSQFWQTNHFRLFISHLAEHKVIMSQLQGVLKEYGISAFVAHKDIEPTKEWQNEIEKALFSMDALVAVLTPNFDKSKWTDQEVGVAIGREVLVIPIRKGMDPYGFIGKFQGLQSHGKTVGQVAQSLFEILVSHAKTKDGMVSSLVNQIVLSTDSSIALKKLDLLRKVETLPVKHLEKVRDDSKENSALMDSNEFVGFLNEMLTERELEKVDLENVIELKINDEIPF